MYWTHLIFALTLGLFVYDDPIIAVKAGYLDFDNLPETNFSCKDKVIGGYYADVETGCQMFHVCTIGQKGEVTDIKFLCLNGTVFDQETRVCERIDEVDCSKSEDFFNLNLELYGNQAGGIQPEEEFFCEDCSTEEDDYADITTRPTSTTTTTTTTTTRPTTTTTTTRPTTAPTQKVAPHYQTSNPETIAALIALHNAFSQSVQNNKAKAPPPRVINNAFAGVTPSTPRSTYFGRPQVTQLPPRDDGQYEDETDHRAHQNHRLAPQDRRQQDHRQQDHRIAQQDQRIVQQDHRIAQQDQRILQQDHRIAQQDHRILQQDHRLVQQDHRDSEPDHRIAQQDHRILQQDHRLAQQDHRASDPDHREQYTHTQTHHGNLQPPNQHKNTYYQVTTPSNLRANYHHFQSGDSGFVHSFDTGKQYNYQYFQPRKQPEPTAKASVSIVTSTSTSTSIRASKNNDTIDDVTAPGDDFPTGYDDYPDDSIDDAFFRDVPKIRTKRSDVRHANHRYPEDAQETTTQRHRNHRYDWSTPRPAPQHAGNSPEPPRQGATDAPRSGRTGPWPKEPSPWQTVPEIQSSPLEGTVLPEEENPTHREAFLQNLLGSLDMDEHDRQKMAHFFKIEEKGVDQSAGFLHQLGNKLGELIMDDVNKTIHQAQVEEMKENSTKGQMDLNKIDEMWRNHYQEMSQEVDLKFDLGTERSRRDADKKEKLMEELAQDYELVKAKIENVPIPKVEKLEKLEIKEIENEKGVEEKIRIKRQVKGLDTEKFTASHHEPRKRLKGRPLPADPVTRGTVALSGEPPSSREVVPVFEEVDEGDFTTRPYLRLDRTQRPRLTTRSVDSTVRLRFNYEMTTPPTPGGPRNRANSRSVSGESTLPSYGALPRLTPPSVTRDVSKLKDTPVYEESDFADPGPALGQQGVQIYRPVAQFVQEVSPASVVYPSPEEFESPTTREPEVSSKRPRRPSVQRSRPSQDRTPSRQLQPEERQPSSRIRSQDRIPSRSRAQENRPAARSRSQDDRPVQRSRSQQDTPSRSRSQPARTRTPQTSQGRHRQPEPPAGQDPETAEHPETENYPATYPQTPAPSNYAPTPIPTAYPQTTAANYPELQQPSAQLETQQPANYLQDKLPEPAEHTHETRNRGSVRDRDFKFTPEEAPTLANYPQGTLPEAKPERSHETRNRGSVRDRDFKFTPEAAPTLANYPQGTLPEAKPERSHETRNRGSVRDRDFNFTPEEEAPTLAPKRARVVSRGKVRGTLRSTTPPNEPPPAPPMDPSLVADPNFSCEGKIKGGFYADVSTDCKGFFICSQGQINGPLLKSHFWCGTNTKFNQRSRTCQDETLVECSVSDKYYHLNQDFAIPETEEQLKPAFEPLRERNRG